MVLVVCMAARYSHSRSKQSSMCAHKVAGVCGLSELLCSGPEIENQ